MKFITRCSCLFLPLCLFYAGPALADSVESSFVFPPSSVIDRFDIVFAGLPATASVPVPVVGGVKLRHSLAGLAPGSHTVFAMACNLSGCGLASPTLSFIAGPGIVNFTGTLIVVP